MAISRPAARFRPGWAPAPILAVLLLSGCGSLEGRLELKQGNEAYLKGDFQAAIDHYEKASAKAPGEPRARLNEAYSYVALSRQAGSDVGRRKDMASKAVDAFEKYAAVLGGRKIDAKSNLPDRERVDQHILTLYLDSGQPDQAVNFLKTRLDRNPRDLPALQMLSTISADRGDLVSAADWQRKRLAMEPNQPEAHYSFGVFAWRASYYNQTTNTALRDSLVNEGIAELEKALQLQPDYFEALSYMTLLYKEKAKNATNPDDVALAEAKSKEYRDRAMAVQKKAGGGKAPAEKPTGSMAGAR